MDLATVAHCSNPAKVTPLATIWNGQILLDFTRGFKGFVVGEEMEKDLLDVQILPGPIYVHGPHTFEWSDAMGSGSYTTQAPIQMPGEVLEFHTAQDTLWALCDVQPRWWQFWRKKGLQWFEVPAPNTNKGD